MTNNFGYDKDGNEFTKDDCVLICDKWQNTYQYDNYGVEIYRNPNGDYYHVENMINETRIYSIDSSQYDCEGDLNDLMLSYLSDWIDNEDDSFLTAYCWYPERLETEQIKSADYNQPVRIIVKSFYYGYEPIDYLRNDNYEAIVFENAKSAFDWIEEQNSETYYLSHNEAGRPTYYIVNN